MDRKLDLDNAFSDLFTRRKLFALILSWLVCILALVLYRTISPNHVGVPRPDAIEVPLLDRNETGAFVSWRKSTPADSVPACKVQFDNLKAENGHLGFFRTASNKTANIDNLRVTFLRPDTADCNPQIRLEDFCDLFAPRRQEPSEGGRIGVLSDLQDGPTDCSISIDMTNTTLVQVRNMDWEIRCGDAPVLKVHCRRACLRADTPYVLLQGHATITTPTARLEGNCIKMNVRDNCFVVDGRYLLTRNGRRQNGVGGCFDTKLKPYQIVSSDGKERNEWTHEYPLAVF